MKKLREQDVIADFIHNIWCRLQPSQFHGVGVFAIRDIPKGTDPFPTLINIPELDDNFKIPVAKIFDNPQIADSVKKMIRDFYPITDGFIFVPMQSLNDLTTAYYINHSKDHFNMVTHDGATFVTNRDIKEGEELLVDYGTYSDQ